MPKTGWQEPARDKDDLLQLPKGRQLTPTEEVHECIVVEETLHARPVERAASVDETLPLTAVGMPRTPDGSEDYDGDSEDGHLQLADTASILSGEDATALPSADDNLGDGELFASDERGTGAGYESTHVPSSPLTSTSTDARPVQASKGRSKTLRQGTESIQPHLTDPTKAIVTYRVTIEGKPYDQETEVPEMVPAPANISSSSGSIIFPDVEASTIPRALRGSPWTPISGASGYEWTRGDGDKKKTWRINVFFRRLDRDTYAYQDMYVNTNLLKSVDPNNKQFRTAYNKWVLQFARRQDASYTQKVARVHWNAAERRALFTAINVFCSKFGIHKFGVVEECRLSAEQLQLMADAVNASPNPSRSEPRGVDAVRGQITSAHNKSQPKNKPIFDLLAKGVAFRARMSGGETIPEAEQKPKAAISLSEFPADPPVAATPPLIPGGKKRKRIAAVEEREPSSSELSSPSASRIGGSRGVQPGESEGRNWSDTSEEVLSGER
ncbi:hypothetical protein N0V86_003067 [Didymella sp. IMI 355093]|nr:hypothetical protein N0V86_003067 [Didymella sp. IMI 355093]